MFIKHYVEDNYFVGFDPDVEELRAKLFREAEKARHREEYGLGDES
jgi:hypothetical protein